MDAYNSSDDEDVIPPPPNPFANSGTRAIKNMLENAEEARKQSKVASRGLQLVYGAKGSQYLRQRAKNLFFAFYTGVLGHREDRFPTYEDFERFLLDIPHRLDGRHANGTVSESTVVSLQTDVLQVLEETFEGFKISKGNEARIKSVFYTLRQKGLITTTPSREMQWITSNVLFEMLQTTFRNAITTGTPSWSIVIAKALSLALVSATAARVGDVSRSHRYADDYVLKWADVTIKVSEDEVGRPVFRAKITLRHTKGHKDDASFNPVIILNSATHSCYNVMDPVKLALIMALRTGATVATTIDELMEQTLARSDRTVQWAHPDRPVLCEFANDQGRGLVVERPAFVTQLNNTLKAAARAIGVTVKVTAHDLRRGTAQGTARLATPTGIESAAAVLYHKPGSVASGVTQRYVGTIGPTDWEKRTGLEDDQDFSLLTNGKRQKLSVKSAALTKTIDGLGGPEDATTTASIDDIADVLTKDSEGSLGLMPEASIEENGRPTSEDFTTAGPMEFIRIASTINVSTTSDVHHNRGHVHTLTHTSVGPLLQFLLYCRHGCGTTAKSVTQMAIHTTGCQFERVASAVKEDESDEEIVQAAIRKQQKAADVRQCPRDGCSTTYRGKSAQNSIAKHIRETHDFVGIKCDLPSCEDSTVWTTYKKLADHKASHSWPPRKCPMNCKSRTFFKDKNGLMAHLKGVHNMLTKDASAMAQRIEVKEEG